MIGRRVQTCLVLAAAVLAVTATACVDAAELWRDSPGGEDCNLQLINDLGAVLIAASPGEGSPAVVRGDPELKIESSVLADNAVLAVAWRDSTGDTPADVEVTVPPGCKVEVRTDEGAVQLSLGQRAFSVDISTVTGDISACVHPEADATINFATSGEITTDFTIEIERKYHVEPDKHGRIALQPGSLVAKKANRVQLSSRRGAVRMLRCAGE